MKKELNNYAFIDSQNLNLGILELGWKLDFKRFRVYLKEKYAVTKAYLFIGYLPNNQDLYDSLNQAGYQIIFKPVINAKNGKVKGNVDAELVLQAMIDYQDYNKAVIVTGDGDFYCLVRYLLKNNKLLRVVAPNRCRCSTLLKRVLPSNKYLIFMNDKEKFLGYK